MIAENYKKIIHLLLLTAIFTAVILPTMGRVSLWEIDEGRYLVCAQNAIDKGRWIIPEYNGRPRIAKPPLMVWLVAASSVLFNHGKVNEFTARLPSAVAAFLTVLLLYLFIYNRLKDPDTAFFSAFVLLTSYLFVKQARFAITDMVLLFFVTSSIFALINGFEQEKRWSVIGGFILMGFGFMDKGPVAFVIPSCVVLLYLYSRQILTDSLKKRDTLIGFLLFLAISVWWPLYVGKPYWEKFIIGSNVKRFAYNPSWRTSMFFYLFNFPANFFVWSAFIPVVFHLIKRKTPDELSLFFIWFCFVFVLFSISDTKRSSYILPLYPAAAAITGWALNRLKPLENRLTEFERTCRISKTLLFTSLAAIGVSGFGKILLKAFSLDWLFTILAVSAVYAFILYILREKTVKLFLSAALGFALIYTNVYQPLADKAFHSPKYCSSMIKEAVKDGPLFVYGSIRANELFYINREIHKLDLSEKARTKGVYVYTRKPRKFEKRFPHAEKILCCSYQKETLCLYKLK